MNTKIIKLDLNRILYEKIIAKQGDTKSRFLLFQLLDGSIAFNLTNRSVRAYMVKPDGKEIFNDLIINNYSLGYCTLELTNQVLAVPGTVKIELMVTEEDRKLTSSVFELEVIKSINSEKSIVSTNEFTALLNGLSSLSEYDNYKNEIAAARDGEVNLLTKVKKIDEQLDTNVRETNSKIDMLTRLRNGHIPYGRLKMPDDFIKLPCNFTKKNNGEIIHDFNFDKYKIGKEIFCATFGVDSGSSSGDGTREKPYKNISRALEDVASSSETNFVIKCLDSYFLRASGPQDKTIDGKTVAIIPDNDKDVVYLTSHYPNLSWTKVDNMWKASRSSVYSIFCFKNLDEFKLPKPVENKKTLEECNNEANTWYTDDIDIYINTVDGLKPDNTNYCINVSNAHFEPKLINGAKLYVENAVIMHGRSTVSCRIAGDENSLKEEFICNNVAFLGGDLKANRKTQVNAMSTLNVGKTYLFNCKAAYGGEDGFNYHFGQVPAEKRRDCLVIECNCVSYGHGKYSDTNTANASTNHNGANILRINGNYFDCTGPLVNDANGCYSVLFNCNSSNSLATKKEQRSAFRFDNDGETNGKAVLINCNGGGADTYSCYSGDDLDITLQAFRGTKFPDNFRFTIQD